MVTLSAVVPATDRPVTLDRCLDAIARADPGPTRSSSSSAGRASAAGARNAGARRATGDVIVFVDADVEVHRDAFVAHPGCVRRRSRPGPRSSARTTTRRRAPTTVSAFRNLLHHHVHQASAGPADDLLDRARSGAARRVPRRSAASTKTRYPHPSVEDIELGRRLSDAGAADRARPDHPGNAPQGVDAAVDAVDRLRAPRHSLGRARVCAQRRLSSALNLGWRHRLSAAACVARRRRAGARRVRHRAGRRSAVARRAEPLVLRAAAPPAGLRACASPASACTRCTTSSPSPRCRSGVAAALGAHATGAWSRRRVPRRSRATRRRSSNDVAPRPYRARRLRATRRAGYIPALAARRGRRSSSRSPTPIRSAATAPRASRPRRRAGCHVHRCDHVARAGRSPTRWCWPRRRRPTSPTPRRGDGRRGGARREAARARRRGRGGARGVDATAVGRVQPSLRPGRPRVRAAITRRRRRRPPPRDQLPPAQLARPFGRTTTRCSTSGPTSSTGPAGSPRSEVTAVSAAERRPEPRRPHRVPRPRPGHASSPTPTGSTTR